MFWTVKSLHVCITVTSSLQQLLFHLILSRLQEATHLQWNKEFFFHDIVALWKLQWINYNQNCHRQRYHSFFHRLSVGGKGLCIEAWEGKMSTWQSEFIPGLVPLVMVWKIKIYTCTHRGNGLENKVVIIWNSKIFNQRDHRLKNKDFYSKR